MHTRPASRHHISSSYQREQTRRHRDSSSEPLTVAPVDSPAAAMGDQQQQQCKHTLGEWSTHQQPGSDVANYGNMMLGTRFSRGYRNSTIRHH
jgi:hypothetical protein